MTNQELSKVAQAAAYMDVLVKAETGWQRGRHFRQVV